MDDCARKECRSQKHEHVFVGTCVCLCSCVCNSCRPHPSHVTEERLTLSVSAGPVAGNSGNGQCDPSCYSYLQDIHCSLAHIRNLQDLLPCRLFSLSFSLSLDLLISLSFCLWCLYLSDCLSMSLFPPLSLCYSLSTTLPPSPPLSLSGHCKHGRKVSTTCVCTMCMNSECASVCVCVCVCVCS